VEATPVTFIFKKITKFLILDELMNLQVKQAYQFGASLKIHDLSLVDPMDDLQLKITRMCLWSTANGDGFLMSSENFSTHVNLTKLLNKISE